MRGAAVGLLALVLVGAGGCGRSKTLSCDSSVDQYCGTDGCARTWEQALTDQSFCQDASIRNPRHDDCGAYHVVSFSIPDITGSYYYSVATGELVAVVVADGFANSTTCAAGPPDGFTPPTCTGAGSEPLDQCFDGGAD